MANTEFDAVLDAAGRLSLDEQQMLVDILRHRITERRRSELAKDVRDAQREFRDGRCSAATPGELLKDILP